MFITIDISTHRSTGSEGDGGVKGRRMKKKKSGKNENWRGIFCRRLSTPLKNFLGWLIIRKKNRGKFSQKTKGVPRVKVLKH